MNYKFKQIYFNEKCREIKEGIPYASTMYEVSIPLNQEETVWAGMTIDYIEDESETDKNIRINNSVEELNNNSSGS